MTRLTDDDLNDLVRWARDTDMLQGAIVLAAVLELQERRATDRLLVNSRDRNSRWPGQRRRK